MKNFMDLKIRGFVAISANNSNGPTMHRAFCIGQFLLFQGDFGAVGDISRTHIQKYVQIDCTTCQSLAMQEQAFRKFNNGHDLRLETLNDKVVDVVNISKQGGGGILGIYQVVQYAETLYSIGCVPITDLYMFYDSFQVDNLTTQLFWLLEIL